MNAAEARTLTEKYLPSLDIKIYLDNIYTKVAAAATKGESCIDSPFKDVPWPSRDERIAVWRHLQEQGYRISIHPDSNPSDPEDDKYTLVCW